MLDRVLRLSLLIVLLLLVAVFGALKGGAFLSFGNLTQLVSAQVPNAAVAMGIAVVLIAGELDLSVASVMGLSAGVVALCLVDGIPAIFAILIAIACGAGIGAVNGILAAYFRVDSIVVTLATGSIATGIGLAVVGPNTISGLPNGLLSIFDDDVWGQLQASVLMLLGIVVIATVVLQFSPAGRRLFFTGQNSTSARLAGINTVRVKFLAFVVAGVLSATAGIFLAMQSDGAGVTEASGFLLSGYAAAFLSTAVIVPGRFNAFGVLIGVLVLGVASVGFNELLVPDWATYLFDGAVLIASLGFFTILQRGELGKRWGRLRRSSSSPAPPLPSANDGIPEEVLT